jgi:hypothetical protein
MALLVALFGPQQVGKSTAAISLVQNHGLVRVAFADPLYRMLAALLELSVEATRRLPKNEPMEALGGRTVRHMLQTLGTEWGRTLMADDLWVETARRKILEFTSSGTSVVVDDLRFANEYAMLGALGCRFVRLHRDGVPEQVNPTHGSEVAWHSFASHAEVVNPPDGAENWARKAGEAVLAALRAA